MKRVYYYSRNDLEWMKSVAKAIDFGVSLDIVEALNETRNAIFMLQQNKQLYRHKVKQLASEIAKAVIRIEQEIKAPMIHKGFFFEYSDIVIDLCYDDIDCFRRSIDKVMEEGGVCCHELFSYIETARTMCDLAVKHFDTIIEESKRKGSRDYTKEFSEFRIGSLYNKMEKLCDLLFKGCKVDLNTKETKAAFEVIADKFASGKYVEPCLKTACEKYPEFKNTEIKTIEQ